MIRKENAYLLLLNPIYIGSLILLILNDLYLKFEFPSFITGKLSDFTGVFCFATVLFLLLSRFYKKKSAIRGSFAISVLILALFQVPLLLHGINTFLAQIGLPETTLTSDFTDILVVIIYPMFNWFINYYIEKRFQINVVKHVSWVSVLCVSMVWFVATSYSSRKLLALDRSYQYSSEIDEFISNLTLFLEGEGFENIDHNSDQHNRISFYAERPEVIQVNPEDSFERIVIWNFKFRKTTPDSLVFNEVILSGTNFDVEHQADSLVNNYFLPKLETFLEERE